MNELKAYIMLIDINTLTIIRIYPNGAVNAGSGSLLLKNSYIDKNEYMLPFIKGHYYQFFSNRDYTNLNYFDINNSTPLSNIMIST